MNLLHILFPRVRAEVLRLLFADEGRELYLRELTRESGLSLGTVQGELKKLSGADLILSRRDGNRCYYRANAAHPVFHDMRHLVLKTSGLHDVLAEALAGVAGIRVAFVFGSLASGTGRSGSDVDLIVIGTCGMRSLVPGLRMTSERLGREVNPVAMTEAEYRERRSARDPFLDDVMSKDLMFVKGDLRELERLG